MNEEKASVRMTATIPSGETIATWERDASGKLVDGSVSNVEKEFAAKFDAAIEQELAAKAVAPRVTAAAIEQAIASEHYFTAREGVLGELATNDHGEITPDAYEQPTDHVPMALGLLTICVLVLRNGFTVTGTSACARRTQVPGGMR